MDNFDNEKYCGITLIMKSIVGGGFYSKGAGVLDSGSMIY